MFTRWMQSVQLLIEDGKVDETIRETPGSRRQPEGDATWTKAGRRKVSSSGAQSSRGAGLLETNRSPRAGTTIADAMARGQVCFSWEVRGSGAEA